MASVTFYRREIEGEEVKVIPVLVVSFKNGQFEFDVREDGGENIASDLRTRGIDLFDDTIPGYRNFTTDDGLDFLNRLPLYYKGSYLWAALPKV